MGGWMGWWVDGLVVFGIGWMAWRWDGWVLWVGGMGGLGCGWTGKW